MTRGLLVKSTGLVLDTFHQPALAEPSATTLKDYSRWGNDGIFLGDGHPDWVQIPPYGLWVMSFNGVGDRVLCGDIPNLEGDITILMWVKPPATLALDCVWGKDYDHEGELFINTDGELRWWQKSAAHNAITNAGDVVGGVWQQIGIRRIVSTKKLYGIVNGQIKIPAGETYAADVTASSAQVSIGARWRTATVYYPFTGLIAPPRIYIRGLSDPAIGKHFTAERAWFGV